MSRGIIYIMSTVVPGLIKIGKTDVNNFEVRMNLLEKNGYSNITGLRREFAIEVDEYNEKEKLIHRIFEKSRLSNTEFFALDIDLVISLFSSLDGIQIYPKNITKSDVFEKFTEELKIKNDSGYLPDGQYFLERTVKGFGNISGIAQVKKGKFILLKGSICANCDENKAPKIRKEAIIKNNILQKILNVHLLLLQVG